MTPMDNVDLRNSRKLTNMVSREVESSVNKMTQVLKSGLADVNTEIKKDTQNILKRSIAPVAEVGKTIDNFNQAFKKSFRAESEYRKNALFYNEQVAENQKVQISSLEQLNAGLGNFVASFRDAERARRAEAKKARGLQAKENLNDVQEDNKIDRLGGLKSGLKTVGQNSAKALKNAFSRSGFWKLLLKGLGIAALLTSPEGVAKVVEATINGVKAIGEVINSDSFKKGMGILMDVAAGFVKLTLTGFKDFLNGITNLAIGIKGILTLDFFNAETWKGLAVGIKDTIGGLLMLTPLLIGPGGMVKALGALLKGITKLTGNLLKTSLGIGKTAATTATTGVGTAAANAGSKVITSSGGQVVSQVGAKGATGAVKGAGKFAGVAKGGLKFLGKAAPLLGGAISGVTTYAETGDMAQAVGAGGGSMAGTFIGGAIGTALGGPVGTVIGSVVGNFIGEFLGKHLGKFIGSAFKKLGNVFKGAGDLIKKRFEFVGKAFSFGVDLVKKGFTMYVDQYKKLFGAIGKVIKGAAGLLGKAFKGLTGLITGIPKKMVSLLSNVYDFWKDLPKKLIEMVGAAIKGLKDNALGFLNPNRWFGGGEKKQSGGTIPGSGFGDKVPAMLEPGEFVLNRNAVKAIGVERLNDINFNEAPRFQEGGSIHKGGSRAKSQKNETNNTSSTQHKGGERANPSTAGEKLGNLKGRAATVALGKHLWSEGYRGIWQHPDFHVDKGFTGSGQEHVWERPYNSYHNHGEALDFALSHNGEAKLDRLHDYLNANREAFGIKELLWRTAGHDDHVHVAAVGGNGTPVKRAPTEGENKEDVEKEMKKAAKEGDSDKFTSIASSLAGMTGFGPLAQLFQSLASILPGGLGDMLGADLQPGGGGENTNSAKEQKKKASGSTSPVSGEAGGDMVAGAKMLMDAGIPSIGAAYLAGNIQQESSWNGQRSWGEVMGDGTSRNGGLVSWAEWSDDPARLGKIEKYLGKDISEASDSEQINAMLWEMETHYPQAYATFMNPDASRGELIAASKAYWGYGHEGPRYTYAAQAHKAIQDYTPGQAGGPMPGTAKFSQAAPQAPMELGSANGVFNIQHTGAQPASLNPSITPKKNFHSEEYTALSRMTQASGSIGGKTSVQVVPVPVPTGGGKQGGNNVAGNSAGSKAPNLPAYPSSAAAVDYIHRMGMAAALS